MPHLGQYMPPLCAEWNPQCPQVMPDSALPIAGRSTAVSPSELLESRMLPRSELRIRVAVRSVSPRAPRPPQPTTPRTMRSPVDSSQWATVPPTIAE